MHLNSLQFLMAICCCVAGIKAYSYLARSLVDNVCLAERGYQVSPGDPSSDDYGQFKDYYEMRLRKFLSFLAETSLLTSGIADIRP